MNINSLRTKKFFISVISILVIIVLLTSVIQSRFIIANAETNESQTQQAKHDETEFLSYMTVFKYYFNKLNDKYNNIDNHITINEFMQMYYSQNNTIKEFTDNFPINQFAVDIQSDVNLLPNNPTPNSTTSADENYMLGAYLGNEYYTEANYFKRTPIYEAFDYSLIYEGDIIYESASKMISRHVAFIYETSQPSAYGNYVQTIEAAPNGVEYGFLDDDRMVRFGVIIYRIHRATSSAIEIAKNFIKLQLGKPFNYNMVDNAMKTNTSSDTPSWYCSELIFAAYYKAGYNICSNNSLRFDPETMPCLPIDITKGLLSERVNISQISFLELYIESFTYDPSWDNSYWSITIYNPNSESLTVQYNRKMCFLQDAKNWTGLKHVETITINKYSQKTVTINQNALANSIAVSYIKGNYRYVTYGTDLYKIDLTLNTATNKIAI